MPSIINRRGRPPYPDILTPSEWQVLEGVRAGLTNQEIAARLGVTFHTVKFHISNMLSKLHLDDRQQLATWRPKLTESERHGRPWRAMLSTGGLKLAGTLAGGVACVGLAASLALAIRDLSPDRSHQADRSNLDLGVVRLEARPADAPAVDPRAFQATPGVRGTIQAMGSARTSLLVTVELSRSLPTGVVPGARSMAIWARTPSGDQVVSARSLDYPLDPDGRANIWTIAIEADPLPVGTSEVVVVIGELGFVPKPGVVLPEPPAGPWTAVISTSAAPHFPDLGGRLPRRVDTGYGWAYVIDSVEDVGDYLAVTYHAEGNISALRADIAEKARQPETLWFQSGTPRTEFVPVPAGATSLVLRFGAAWRVEDDFASLDSGVRESGAWTVTVPLD